MVNMRQDLGESKGKLGDVHPCTPTATRIWQHADQEHQEQDPKMQSQTNLRMLVYCFVLSLRLRVCRSLSVQAYECMSY